MLMFDITQECALALASLRRDRLNQLRIRSGMAPDYKIENIVFPHDIEDAKLVIEIYEESQK
jgi:hypothetical protein